MNGWIVVTPAQANSIEALCFAKARAAGIQCTRWAKPEAHPTDPNLVAYRIKDVVFDALPMPFKVQVIDTAAVKAQGFFPEKFPDSGGAVASNLSVNKILAWGAAAAGAAAAAYWYFS